MAGTKVGVLGSGQVARVLAAGLAKKGYRPTLGTRDAGKVADWCAETGIPAATFEEAARTGDLALLAVKGTAAEDVVRACAPALRGKPVLDATNPIADAPPEDGVLRFFTGPNESLMERLQALAPEARFVKAFSCVGNALMVDPVLAGGRPTMFICGNDAAAKGEAIALLERLGWDVEDAGTAKAARAIEPLCMLWCIPGFLRGDWTHAFKLLRP